MWSSILGKSKSAPAKQGKPASKSEPSGPPPLTPEETKGNLSLNWRLIQAPHGVLDYVVVHELAHLREFNHSKQFWALVAAHCPDYKRWVLWLKQEGWKLRGDL